MKPNTRNYEIDMCSGPLISKLLLFAAPLMLSGVLQLLFNAADIVVVGRFAGSTALAAVGSNGSMVNLIINVFMGMSVGASVLVAKCYGAGDYLAANETVHTAIAIALISGVIVSVFGIVMAPTLLLWMGTPADVLPGAVTYLRIYFLGMPAVMLYNFGAAILRAVGDTRRPLYYLSMAGVINVGLNLLLVIVFHLDVAGVAIATVVSQMVSMVLVMLCLIRSDGCIHLEWRKIKIHKEKMKEILKVGLPAGIQGSVFSISNVLIQSTVNSFGALAMAGNAAAANIEGFVYTGMNAFYQASLAFTGQNLGARKYKRIDKTLFSCLLLVCLVGIGMGCIGYFFGPQLLRIYTSDGEVVAYGMIRLSRVCLTYFLCGAMDVIVGSLRGMGDSVRPMINSFIFVCGVRILWIFTVFAADRTLVDLYTSYPVSWTLAIAVQAICYVLDRKRLDRQAERKGENHQ